MELEIREVRPDDAEAIVGILNPIIAAGVFTAFDTPFTSDSEREYIRTFPTRGVFVVAVKPADCFERRLPRPFAKDTRRYSRSFVRTTRRRCKHI
jgi:hypothetical protein